MKMSIIIVIARAELNSWLTREEKYKWLSPEISNEILLTYSHAVLRMLAEKVKLAEYYGIIKDKTSDISNKEQISICFRIANQDFSIQEIFFGFYEMSTTTSEELFAVLKDVLLRMQFDISKCRGQCYDGASNVSGHVNGLRKKLI